MWSGLKMAAINSGVPGTQDSRSSPINAKAFTELMSGFPTGVAVITAMSASGAAYGLTCSSLVSVTLAPPTVLVSIEESSLTLDVIRQSGHFAVNLLHEQAVRAARLFSSNIPDRFGEVAWEPSPGLRLPWLVDDAFAAADCRLSETHLVGDHVLTIGQVMHIEQSARMPLMYGMRRYAAWPEESEPDGVPGVRPEAVMAGRLACPNPCESEKEH
jgi:flavin reductase (NADH)